jgi:4-amino-4-deoxy-L-arabinose transferase-like glycosyltransferase
VTTSTDIARRKNANELLLCIGWTALICATLYVCYFSHLGAIGFVGPDEPRYAWIARDMAETGDWVTPRLYGKPWFEKPPLYYWGAAICFKLFGVSEAAARLPSAISALLATLAIAWLAWRTYDAETARWLLLLLPTTVGMIGFSHAAATDMPFSGTLTIAMVCAAMVVGLVPDEWCRDGAQHAAPLQEEPHAARRRWLALILFGFFVGLAVLAKGPAAIILCGGAVFFWALFSKRWRAALRLVHPVAIAAFCLTALPWYILCARRNPDFFRVFIIEHNFKRYLTPEFQHIQPFWFYVPILIAALLPWSTFLFPVISDAIHSFRNRPGTIRGMFFMSFAAFPIVFFTLSKSKLPGYILPAVPPLVLLCSDSAKEMLATNSRLAREILGSSAIAAIISVALAVRYSLHLRLLAPFPAIVYDAPMNIGLLHLLGFVLGLSALVLVFLRRSRMGLVCTAAALVAVIGSANLANFDLALSPRRTSQAIAKMTSRDVEVLSCELPRSAIYGFNFYVHHEISEWKPQRPEGRAIIVVGRPSCFDAIKNANYSLRAEVDFPKWTLVEVEASLAAHAPSGGQPK